VTAGAPLRVLRLDGDGTHSRQVAGLVAVIAGNTCLPRRQTYRLRLAVDEFTTNSSEHGYHGRGGAIDLIAGADPELVWIRVEDDAAPFDPRRHDPDPRLALGPDGPVGGYGLYIALRSVDVHCYEYVNGRNRNTLCVRRTS
jgi:serine/threonine-protein kinase RsbW